MFLIQRYHLILCLCAAVLLSAANVRAQGGSQLPDTDDPHFRLRTLGVTIQQQIKRGPINETEFAAYLEELGKLLPKFEDPKSTEVGQVLLLSAQICLEVFEDCDAAAKYATRFDQTFDKEDPQSLLSGSLWEQIERCRAREKAREEMIGKPAPPISFSWSSERGLKSLDQLKGKVVVLDFWVNTNQKCVSLFPTIRRLQDRFQGLDVAIVGVTHPVGMIAGLRSQPMDFTGKPDREIRTLAKYRKVKNINWILAATKDPSFLKAYQVSRYPTMVIIDPDGNVRHANIRHDVAYLTRAEMIDRILKEYGRSTSGLVR